MTTVRYLNFDQIGATVLLPNVGTMTLQSIKYLNQG